MRRIALIALCASSSIGAASAFPASAIAGTYPMYQCAASHPGVAAGWSVFRSTTNASNVLQNSCASGGAIEDYVFSHGEPGAVEENGSNGSQVGIALDVPSGAPNVSISAISAKVQVSSVTGNDAFLGFVSAGQGLAGAAEIHNGGSSYAAQDSWTLPVGARDFQAYVNCSTDGSNTNCHFAEASHVPALSNITLTLVDTLAPTLSAISGTLATAAAQGSTVSGSQSLGFTANDADSGALSSTLTLTPQGSGAPYAHTTSFAAQCTYESWNACPLTQNVSPFSVPTATLKDGTYAVALTATDAAGNLTSQSLGTVTTHNAPTISSAPAITGNPEPGQSLSVSAASYASDAQAGKVSSTDQWQLCDSAGQNCVAISGASGSSYNVVSADEGHMLRVKETISNSDGETSTESAPFGPIHANATQGSSNSSTGASTGTGGSNTSTTSTAGSTTGGSTAGAGGTGGTGGAAGQVTLTLASPLLQGSTSPWQLSLTVAPRTVHRGTRITLRGVVNTSPRPASGKLVFLRARSVNTAWRHKGHKRRRVRVYTKWITFLELRTGPDGRFTGHYRFRFGGRHVYQFTAIAPQEGGFLDTTGSSRIVTITEKH